MHMNRDVVPGFLRPRQAAQWLGVSVSTLNRMEAHGWFPKRRRVSLRCVGWPRAIIDQWLLERQPTR
jgi:predicted DNA-binding transcriptional regulator AlpA